MNVVVRSALDLARSLHKTHPKEAKRLLQRIGKATEEEAVIQEAQMLLETMNA